jgi:hypothetical protein
MKRKTLLLLFTLAAMPFLAPPLSGLGESFMLGQEAPSRIFVNNRILAKVNGKAISVIDVMKKMDMLFYKQFPQYTSIIEARFQFYQLNWKKVLQDLIDKELILAEAEEKKMPLNSGEVRQEMESLFGPNIIVNLDKVGLTFEEAWKMVQDDITLRRMVYIRANVKAMKKVTPQDVRSAYEEYAKKNQRAEQWDYRVISIRDPDPAQGKAAASLAHRYLTEQAGTLEGLVDIVKADPQFGQTAKVTISEPIHHEEQEISPAYKEALVKMSGAKSYSEPLMQTSRTDKTPLFRIFYLEKRTPGGVVPFSEVEGTIKGQLTDAAIEQATRDYLNKLRHHYHLKESHLQEFIPENFEPFVLK